MKNKLLKRLGIIVLSVAITLGAASVNPLCVYAEEIEEQESSEGETNQNNSNESNASTPMFLSSAGPAEETVPPIEELNATQKNMDDNREGSDAMVSVGKNQVMDTNYGYIDTNDGLVKQNGGTNEAESDVNAAKSVMIVDNNHYVVCNNGRINNNNNFVAQNRAQGVIDNNNGKVAENKGTISVNDEKGVVLSNTNLVITNDGGIINSGKVLANFGKVELDTEIKDAKSTIVHNFSTGTYDENTTVENHWWEIVFDKMSSINTQWKTSTIHDLFEEEGILSSNVATSNNVNLVSRTFATKGTKYYAKQGADLVIAPINGYELDKIVLCKLGTNEEIILSDSDIVFNEVSGEWVIRNIKENVTIKFEFKGNSNSQTPSQIIKPSESVKPKKVDVVVINDQQAQLVQPVQAKQAEIVSTLTQALNVVETMTPQQIERLKVTGLSIDAGGCSVADANVSSLIVKALNKGIPMNISFVANGNFVSFTIPAGFDISQFINIDGTIDFVKLFNAISQRGI